MGKLFLVIFAFLLLGSGYFVYQKMTGNEIPLWQNDTQTVEEKARADAVFAETNTWRQNRVLSTFRTDEQLCSFALRRAQELAKDPSKTFNQFLQKNPIKIAIPYQSVGELAGSGVDPLALVQQWSENSTTQPLLEGTDFSHSCVRCSEEMCVQILIRPQ